MKRSKQSLAKKKGETLHHLSYDPEITVMIPSRGSHLILTSFQSMGATKRNIKYLRDYEKAVRFIRKQKIGEYKPAGKIKVEKDNK
jgi:hypothetical protein